MTFLIVTFFILLFVALIVAAGRFSRRNDSVIYNDIDEDEVVTHTTVTTTTTTQDAPLQGWTHAECAEDFGRHTVGTITRGWQDNKPYVIDPVDGTTMQLAETDDLYEDAAGKMWNLV